MQDAHNTVRPEKNDIHQKKNAVIIGCGVDIFQSRFTPDGPLGFSKAPILSLNALSWKATTLGKTTFHLPANVIIKRLDQNSMYKVSSHSPILMAKTLGKIVNQNLPLGAFHQEVYSTFSSLKAMESPQVCSISQHNQIVCSMRLSYSSRKELRSMARSEVTEVLDSFCMQPNDPQKKNILFSLFNDYGAFICTGLLYGGTFRQETRLVNKNYPVDAAIDALSMAAYKEKIGAHLSLNEAQALDFTDHNKQTSFSFKGGDPLLYEKLGIGRRHERENHFNRWARSLYEGKHLKFIDFSSDGIIPIWNLAKHSQDSDTIAQVFQEWYHNELIRRELLPEVITQVKLIEKDSPLDKNDNAGFSHRTDIISQRGSRYLYLGYEKEPAHRVIQRKGSMITQLHLATWKKWSEQYQRIHTVSTSANKLERVTNQYEQFADLAPGQPHPQLGTRLDIRKETASLKNLPHCIQDIQITRGPYSWTHPPYSYKKLNYNLQGSSGRGDYYYIYLSYQHLN